MSLSLRFTKSFEIKEQHVSIIVQYGKKFQLM